MSDFLIFWYDHNRLPELSQREQLILCAAVRHEGYYLRLATPFRRKR